MRILRLAVLVLALGCASGPLSMSIPYSAQLFGPGRETPPRPGRVIGEKPDGSRLFAFDDQTEGDNGYIWISPEDKRYRIQPGSKSMELGRMPALPEAYKP